MQCSAMILSAVLGFTAVACSREATVSDTTATAPIQVTEPVPNATIHDIMALQANPAADEIWDSVKAVSDELGFHEIRPETDAEWTALEAHANTLIGVAELLREEGRAVVSPGMSIEASETLDVAGIEATIAADHELFVQKADGLGEAARQVLSAIKARDPVLLELVGGDLDEACEACHTVFYYPGQ